MGPNITFIASSRINENQIYLFDISDFQISIYYFRCPDPKVRFWPILSSIEISDLRFTLTLALDFGIIKKLWKKKSLRINL